MESNNNNGGIITKENYTFVLVYNVIAFSFCNFKLPPSRWWTLHSIHENIKKKAFYFAYK